MNWDAAIEEEVAVLKRIVALLFALAGLAERAADRSPAVRALILWLLRHAECAARKLVPCEPDACDAPLPVVPAGGSSADALQLAARLRALAMQIDLQARLAAAAFGAPCGEPDHLAAGGALAMRNALDSLATLAAFAGHGLHRVRAPDTS